MINTFLKSIATGVVGIGLSVSSFLGITPAEAPQVNQNLGAFNVTAGGTYRLNSSVGTTDTSIKLSSFKEPISNTPYTMAYMNTSIAYGTLDPQQPSRSELISFSGITQNADGTAILTGVTRGLSRSYPYTASSTFRVAHPGQSIFILSDAPQVFNAYTSAGNDAVVTGSWSFPTPTTSANPVTLGYATSTFVDFASNQTITGNKTFSGASTLSGTNTFSGLTSISNGNTATFNGLVNLLGGLISASTTFTTPPTSATAPSASSDLANKAYVDGVAIAGAPIANNTTTGIGRTASSTQISSGYSSTTPYFIPSSLASSTASTTSSIVVATNATTGRIDSSFISQSLLPSDYSDGDFTATTTTNLTRDMYYDDLVVNNGVTLNTKGYRIFARTVTNNGIIDNSGISVTSGTTGGAGASAGTIPGGLKGGDGAAATTANTGVAAAAGTNSTFNIVSSEGSTGGAGGGGVGTGGAGGAGGTNTSTTTPPRNIISTFSLTFSTGATTTQRYNVNSGSGGGGGGGGNSGVAAGGAGGGAGGSGGIIFLVTETLTNNGVISANGGTGAVGGDGTVGAKTGGGGGGAGGNGGVIFVIYKTKIGSGTITATGGIGGIGGTPGTSGGIGVTGANGSNGLVIQITN